MARGRRQRHRKKNTTYVHQHSDEIQITSGLHVSAVKNHQANAEHIQDTI